MFGDQRLFQQHADWHDLLTFSEYFDGDTGAGLGASHQTGWTALVVDLVLRDGKHTEERGEYQSATQSSRLSAIGHGM